MADGIFNRAIFNDDIFNTHEAIVMSGTHATQQLTARRPALFIPIEFSFRIKAAIIIIQWINQIPIKKLIPVRISQVKLDEAFNIPLNRLKGVWIKALKRESLRYMLKTILMNSDKVELLRILKELFKRK